MKRSYVSKDGLPLYVLAGAARCRAYHLTADSGALAFLDYPTDGTGVTFRSLCGKGISETCVLISAAGPVCGRCERLARVR